MAFHIILAQLALFLEGLGQTETWLHPLYTTLKSVLYEVAVRLLCGCVEHCYLFSGTFILSSL